MRPLNKILPLLFIAVMLLGALCVHAKTKHKVGKGPGITLGFQSGRELLFNSSPLVHSRQSKVHYAISNSLVLRKPINAHFKAETGIKYSLFQPPSPVENGINKYTFTQKPYTVALPVTIQYYLLPESNKIRPYFGAGFQYNLLSASIPGTKFIGDVPNQSTLPTAGTKYISILFTQGVTFEINTKIQVCQSFHFIPCGTSKTFGFDLGVGYKFP